MIFEHGTAMMKHDNREQPILSPNFIQSQSISSASLSAAAESGLLAASAYLPPKLFYDVLGSRLFDAITALTEYYPTRIEGQIMQSAISKIAATVGTKRILVDLGAGNCEKAAKLFFDLQPEQYIAIDISVDHLRQSLSLLQLQHPGIAMRGIGQDFSDQLVLPPEIPATPRVFFYPGSSIGNFTPTQAQQFLQQIQGQLCGGALIMGVDLVKPTEVLTLAYNDPLQVTAAFNLNILRHVNRLLGANFNVQDFEHHALFNPDQSRIEMHLRAKKALSVSWSDHVRHFKAGECIHTENSYKYTLSSLEELVNAAGFGQVEIYTDPDQYFAVVCASST
jgi:L-histidine Nalpha-methyltransferase